MVRTAPLTSLERAMPRVHVHVLYPHSERFDWTYYVEQHMPMAGAKMDLVEWWVAKGLDDVAPAAYQAIATLVFDSLEKWTSSFAAFGPDLLTDIPNYTDAVPTIQVTEISGSGKKA
ncbi:EthD family reductase [Sphingomonas sp. ID0503]|uniref:EthD family reductase n=1 Tax=Sphingomonas sp. ID0503 TaxID=3399691 RepID=UPI003AFA8061